MPRKLALIVGTGEYDDTTLSLLNAPGADVNALATVLRDKTAGGFDEVTPLLDQSANTVRREIARFFSDKQRDDLLLLYFSGHGVLDDQGRLYLAMKDTERNLLNATAIPSSFIREEMDGCFSQMQVLVLDCCHSGAFARGTKGSAGASVGTSSAFEGTGTGRVVLTASDATQYAWEGDQVIGQAENSLFTHYLIQGLRTGEADANGDGQISVNELYDYVYENVRSVAPNQTPGRWLYKSQGEIIIAQNPIPIGPAPLPDTLRQAIDSAFATVRASAVAELEILLNGSHGGMTLAAQEELTKLTEDDSRQVSLLAEETLANYTGEPLIQAQPQDQESLKAESADLEEAPAFPVAEAAAPEEEPAVPVAEAAAPQEEPAASVAEAAAPQEDPAASVLKAVASEEDPAVSVPGAAASEEEQAPPEEGVSSLAVFANVTESWAQADISQRQGEYQISAYSSLIFGPRKAGDHIAELFGTARSLVLTNHRLILVGVGLSKAFGKNSKGEVLLEIPVENIESVGVTRGGFSLTSWWWLPWSLPISLMTRRLQVVYQEGGTTRIVRFHVPKALGWVTSIRCAQTH